MKLVLAPDLALPATAVTQTFGILAVRGAGKSNTATVMAEEMAHAGLPFVVVDPVGAWFGLRSSADGTRPGLPIPIFGGRHKDVPLSRDGGPMMADLIAERSLSCVLDLTGFDSEGDKKAFLLAFARRLYLKNENPLHLFLEEADDYIPQRPMRDEAQLLRAWENIVRRGRARGLGITLITQRSAALNKNVLTQIETLFAMRTTSPQDRAAIEAWVEYHQTGREVVSTLASLKPGEAWVWSPNFLGLMARVQIRRRSTFDSGATPDGKARRASTLADVDLGVIEQQMAATIARAKQDDPVELRKEIAGLKLKLAAAERKAPEVQTVEKPVIEGQQIRDLERIVGELTAALSKVALGIERTRSAPRPYVDPPWKVEGQTQKAPASARHRAKVHRDEESADGLDANQQRILDTIATLNVREIEATRVSVARWMAIHPNGGRYNTNLATLRRLGYLEPDSMELTHRGHVAARARETGLDALLQALPDGPKREIVNVLALSRNGLDRRELAEALGIHPNGGRYNTNLAWLRAMGAIPERGPITLTRGAKA